MKKLLNCKCAEKWGSFAPFILRVVTGLIFLAHGVQKFNGGVENFGGFLGGQGVPAPEFFAWVVVLVEVLGGLALILGLLTHVAAKLLAINMLVAFFLVHVGNGFFISTKGVEFVLLLFAASVALMITGPGPWSFDKALMKKG